jgi:hypothetical protein
MRKPIPMTRCVCHRLLLVGAVFSMGLVLTAKAAGETPAQRQVTEQRERFQREIDRQANEAKAREASSQAALSEAKTAEQVERLRVQQTVLENRIRATPAPENITPIPVTRVSIDRRAADMPVATVVADFSVTFLEDGRCVIYRKGTSPVVKTREETREILDTLMREHPATAPGAPAAK